MRPNFSRYSRLFYVNVAERSILCSCFVAHTPRTQKQGRQTCSGSWQGAPQLVSVHRWAMLHQLLRLRQLIRHDQFICLLCRPLPIRSTPSGGGCKRTVRILRSPARLDMLVPEAILSGMGGRPKKYVNTWDCFQTMLRKEGVRGICDHPGGLRMDLRAVLMLLCSQLCIEA